MTPWNLSLGYLEERRPAPETLDAAMEADLRAGGRRVCGSAQGSAGLSRAQQGSGDADAEDGITRGFPKTSLGAFFPECVAKGSRLTTWGSGGRALFHVARVLLGPTLISVVLHVERGFPTSQVAVFLAVHFRMMGPEIWRAFTEYLQMFQPKPQDPKPCREWMGRLTSFEKETPLERLSWSCVGSLGACLVCVLGVDCFINTDVW